MKLIITVSPTGRVRKCYNLDKCTKKTESPLERENAIVDDSEFEVQEQGKHPQTRILYLFLAVSHV